MHGAVVAVEAPEYICFGGELTGNSCMAQVALLFKNGMGFGQAAAAVNAGVFENGTFGDPHKREQRQQKTEPEFGALQRCRPPEIVEVNALREFFSRACACHVFLLR